MSRKALPSLDTLVFFEAVARHQSFSKAATELKVSQAAVSKRIATLESQLGYPLFDRSTRRPGLTDEGEYLFERTRSALTFLNEGLSDATDKIEPPVRVGTNNLTLSVFCLQDALHRFSTSENACGVSLISTYELDEVLAANLDIAVIYGDGKLNNWHSYRLMDEPSWRPWPHPKSQIGTGVLTGMGWMTRISHRCYWNIRSSRPPGSTGKCGSRTYSTRGFPGSPKKHAQAISIRSAAPLPVRASRLAA